MFMSDEYKPVGLVEVIDADTKETVYKTHNMIVKSGRTLILNSLFNGQPIDFSKFTKYLEKSNNNITIPDMTYKATQSNSDSQQDYVFGSSLLSPIINESIHTEATDQDIDTLTNLDNKDNKVIDLTKLYDKVDVDNTCMVLTFGVDLSNVTSGYSEITSIGLIYNKTANNKILFSRANINPVYMRYGRRYVVKYTIYF